MTASFAINTSECGLLPAGRLAATRRLVLERYAALTLAIAPGIPCVTRLDPPPADSRTAHGVDA